MRGMGKAFKGFLWISLGVFMVGCALQADLVDLESRLEETRAEQNRLKKMVGPPERPGDLAATTQRSLSELVIRTDELRNDLQGLRGELEQDSHVLSQLLQTVDQQGRQLSALDSRISEMERRLAALPGGPPATPPGASAEGTKPPASEQGPPSSTTDEGRVVLPGRPPLSSLAPIEVYNLAYNDYLKGNYDLAIAGFRTFLQQFSESALAPHAAYWLGESYYSKKQYLKALESFDRVIEDYPKSEKLPGSLLKKGFTYLEVGDKTRAQAALKRVVEEYPFSDEAELAKNKLVEIR